MLYLSNLVTGLDNGLDDPGYLMRAADAAQAGIEFFLHAHSPEYRDKVTAIPTWLAGRPCTTHGPFIGVEAASRPHTAEHEHMLDAYRWAFDAAAMLGSRHMVFHTNQRVIEHSELPQAQADCMNSIEELLRMAEPYNIQLLIENLGIQKKGVCLFDEDAFIALFDRFPQAGCIIDTGHLNVAGWSAQRVLSALSSRIEAYHFHNNDGVSDSHLPISSGTFDYCAFMPLYHRYTPHASVTLEYGDVPPVPCERVAHDLCTVRGWLL